MCNKQKDLDNFTSKGKQLLSELKKIHSGDFIVVKTDMESTVDKWLDVSSSPRFYEQFACVVISVVSNSVTLCIVARQAPPAMGFARQEYWSGLPCLPPEDLPNPGIGAGVPAFTAEPPGEDE